MIWLFLTLAFADVIPEPQGIDCPPGSVVTQSHVGEWCIPATCESTEDCAEGSCQTEKLCISEDERECGGMQDPDNPCIYTHVEVHDTCSDNSDCDVGTCEERQVCVSRGCGCTSVGSVQVGVGALLLLAVGLRRQRPDSGETTSLKTGIQANTR